VGGYRLASFFSLFSFVKKINNLKNSLLSFWESEATMDKSTQVTSAEFVQVQGRINPILSPQDQKISEILLDNSSRIAWNKKQMESSQEGENQVRTSPDSNADPALDKHGPFFHDRNKHSSPRSRLVVEDYRLERAWMLSNHWMKGDASMTMKTTSALMTKCLAHASKLKQERYHKPRSLFECALGYVPQGTLKFMEVYQPQDRLLELQRFRMIPSSKVEKMWDVSMFGFVKHVHRHSAFPWVLGGKNLEKQSIPGDMHAIQSLESFTFIPLIDSDMWAEAARIEMEYMITGKLILPGDTHLLTKYLRTSGALQYTGFKTHPELSIEFNYHSPDIQNEGRMAVTFHSEREIIASFTLLTDDRPTLPFPRTMWDTNPGNRRRLLQNYFECATEPQRLWLGSANFSPRKYMDRSTEMKHGLDPMHRGVKQNRLAMVDFTCSELEETYKNPFRMMGRVVETFNFEHGRTAGFFTPEQENILTCFLGQKPFPHIDEKTAAVLDIISGADCLWFDTVQHTAQFLEKIEPSIEWVSENYFAGPPICLDCFAPFDLVGLRTSTTRDEISFVREICKQLLSFQKEFSAGEKKLFSKIAKRELNIFANLMAKLD
jgi:hypothetical protein